MSVIDHIREMAAIALGADLREITADTTWLDLSADEVDRVAFLFELDQEFGLRMSDDYATAETRIGDLAEFVTRHKTKEPTPLRTFAAVRRERAA